jgi:hypothetical protein
MRWALSIPGELIPRAGVWLDPGITPCVKTPRSGASGHASRLAGRESLFERLADRVALIVMSTAWKSENQRGYSQGYSPPNGELKLERLGCERILDSLMAFANLFHFQASELFT